MKNEYNNIDDFIKKVCEDTKIPDNIIDENKFYSKIKNKHKKSNYLKFAACISILIILAIIKIIFSTDLLKNKNQFENKENSNEIQMRQNEYKSNVELPVASYTLNLSNISDISSKFISPTDLDILKEDSDCIAVVKLNKILYYTNYCKKLDFYTTIALTVSDIQVEKIFKGTLNNETEIMSIGGIISLSDFEKGCQPEQILKHGLDKLSQEEKDNTYIKVQDSISYKMPDLENEKYYLVYLKYNNKFEKYQVLDQFMYEYDIDNDAIRNIDTGEWESFSYN